MQNDLRATSDKNANKIWKKVAALSRDFEFFMQ